MGWGACVKKPRLVNYGFVCLEKGKVGLGL